MVAAAVLQSMADGGRINSASAGTIALWSVFGGIDQLRRSCMYVQASRPVASGGLLAVAMDEPYGSSLFGRAAEVGVTVG